MHSGPCLGGPYDGKFMDHEKTELELFERKKMFGPGTLLGHYRWEFGCWIWKPNRRDA